MIFALFTFKLRIQSPVKVIKPFTTNNSNPNLYPQKRIVE